VLLNNGGDGLAVTANGFFTFATAGSAGALYSVTVSIQPSGQTCTVQNGSGTANADVTSVTVNCVNTYSIGGTVSGLVGAGLVLQNNGAGNLPLTVSGAFSFATRVAAGAAYDVTVLTQPSGSTCTVTNGTGTANANLTNVVITCTSQGGLALVANSGVTNGTNGLSVYRVNAATGALSLLSNVNAGNAPYAVAVTPNGLYAYVSNQQGGTVSSYSVDSAAGVVSLIPLSSPLSNNASGIAMDRLGRFIWVANFGFHTLSAFAIGPNGVLAAAGPPLATSSALPYVITAHPTLDFVYVAHSSSNFAITVYSANPANGALTLQQTLANAILSPSGIVIDPSGRFAYAISQTGGVSAFAINASTGVLTTIGSVAIGGAAFAIAAHPNGQSTSRTALAAATTSWSSPSTKARAPSLRSAHLIAPATTRAALPSTQRAPNCM
jgi:6-phosphogluconolactonase (cycloisomerase 2 family)